MVSVISIDPAVGEVDAGGQLHAPALALFDPPPELLNIKRSTSMEVEREFFLEWK